MSQRDPVLFSERQSLRQWHARILLAFPPAALLFITLRQIVWHKPWGQPPMSNGGLIFLCALLVAVYFRLITIRLVTEVCPDALTVGLRGLWKARRIPLDQVQSAEPVSFDPVADFGGYGIRSRRGKAAYLARGNRGLELTLANGQHILIGSQDPAELARQIKLARRAEKP